MSLVLLHGPRRDAIEGLVESTARDKPAIEALYDES
jgi:hypothetical protein